VFLKPTHMIKTVSYQKLFPLGMYCNERIGVEVELGDNQDPMKALEEAKRLTEEFHKQSNPEIYNNVDEETPVLAMIKKEEKKNLSTQDRLIVDISTCTELKVLESYKLLSKKYPEIQDAYDKKYAELSTK
jgi:hypothetical protein